MNPFRLRLTRLLAAVLVLSLVVTACGGQTELTATVEPTPTSTPEPTATTSPILEPTTSPTPEPTATALATVDATADFTEFESPQDGFSLRYPTEGFLLYGDSVTGSVTESGPSAWEFIGLEGEVVDVIVEPLDDGLDVVVNVLDESGTSILESGEVDESFGMEEIRALAIPAPGTFHVTVAGFGGSVGEYQITLTETGATITNGDNLIAYGDSITGTVNAADEAAIWRFGGSEGDVVALAVEPAGDFDAVLDLQDATGASILIGEERDYSFDAEYAIVSLPGDSEYTIIVKGFEGSSGAYELALIGPAGSIVSAGDTLEEGDNEAGHAFPFTASAGEVVGIVVEPEGELDVVIEIQDGNGESMRTRPFDASFGTESFAFGVPEDGNYSFYVKGFEGGLGAYEVTLLGSDRTIFELTYNDVVSGRTGADGLVEYAVNGLAGDIMTVVVEPDSALDVMVEIRDLADNVLVGVDDGVAGEVEELSYTFEEEGLVIIRVHDFFEDAGDFVLTITATTGD